MFALTRTLLVASLLTTAPAGAQVTRGTVSKFLAGSALALAAHESGHLTFDLAFNARPHVQRVHLGAIPFFAVAHRDGMPRHEEFIISSAGFWVQAASDEWILTSRPHLRHMRAPVLKGMLAFNTLTSAGYAAVAFARVGPDERDTRAIADAAGVDERVIGAMILAPAVLDVIRYFKPGARWAVWGSRVVKMGSVALVVK